MTCALMSNRMVSTASETMISTSVNAAGIRCLVQLKDDDFMTVGGDD
jgi:hypothetical protein